MYPYQVTVGIILYFGFSGHILRKSRLLLFELFCAAGFELPPIRSANGSLLLAPMEPNGEALGFYPPKLFRFIGRLADAWLFIAANGSALFVFVFRFVKQLNGSLALLVVVDGKIGSSISQPPKLLFELALGAPKVLPAPPRFILPFPLLPNAEAMPAKGSAGLDELFG